MKRLIICLAIIAIAILSPLGAKHRTLKEAEKVFLSPMEKTLQDCDGSINVNLREIYQKSDRHNCYVYLEYSGLHEDDADAVASLKEIADAEQVLKEQSPVTGHSYLGRYRVHLVSQPGSLVLFPAGRVNLVDYEKALKNRLTEKKKQESTPDKESTFMKDYKEMEHGGVDVYGNPYKKPNDPSQDPVKKQYFLEDVLDD